MSDIYAKTTSGTSSTTWQKAVNMFVKTASGTSSAAWSSVKNVYVYFSAGWTRVWPLSGVFSTTSPYITTSSGSTTPLYGVDGVRRVGTTVWGKNGTWNANGWTINSYQYRWRAYQDSNINDLNIYSQTSLATYSGAVSLSIPASYDRKYLSFFIQANSSGGTAYNGYAESGVEYGGIQIVRRPPVNITKSFSSNTPQVGTQITYSSTWDETDAYAAESYRTKVEWYRNLSNSTSGGTYVGYGTTYTPTSSDLNNYLYAVETRYNSGSDYDYGSTTGVSVSVITTSTVSEGLTAPTNVNIYSMSRYNDTSVNAAISFSGGSGPYYQLYWTTVNPAPVTASYDSASTGSPIADVFAPASGSTYYFYVRSSSDNLGNTNLNGSSASGTYSPYSTAYASYTYSSPTGGTASVSGSSTVGSTLTLSLGTPTASPAADGITIIWRRNDGGTGGNSYTGGSIMQTGGYTYVIDSTIVAYSSVGYSIRAEVTWNNGVGSQSANSNGTLVTAAVTKLATPTNVNASDNRSDGVNVTWTAVSGAAYYGVWYGPTPSYDSAPDFGGPSNPTLITGTSYLDTAIGSGVTRDYYVQAFRTNNPTGTKSEWGGPNSGTRVAASNPPTGGSVSVNPTTGTAGSTTYTASASGWSGTGTISYSYSWQYFSSSSFTWAQVATGTTFSPASNINTLYPNYGWQVVVTASNGVSPNGTASTSLTINTPSGVTAPGVPTSVGLTGSGSVSWGAPSSGGTPTSYEIEFYTATNGSGSGAAGPYTVTGISSSPYQLTSPYASPNNWARVRVRARNSAGASSYSGWVPSESSYT